MEREETIKIISHKYGGGVFKRDDNLDVWINPDKSKSTELKEKIQGLQKGDKVKVTGFDSNDGKFYYTDIEKIEQPKIEEAIEPEEIILGGKDE